ncbi:MAG: cytochrome [Porticoccaceae bacterium]|nr:cytochrome [Porticoccaceae bacterium]
MNLHEPGPIPNHVPEALVETDFPLVGHNVTEENPFDRIVQEACEGPDIVYVPNMVPGGGHAWVLRRYEDLREVYYDVEHFSNKGFASLAKLIDEDWSLVPAEQDAPEHTFYRQLLNPVFAPGSMAKMEGLVRKAATDTLENVRGKTQSDFLEDFTFPFPVGVVLDLMDLPRERMKEFQEWENMILQNGGDFDLMRQGIRNVADYLRGVIAERKDNPGDDLIGFAIKAEVNGRKLTDKELLGYAFNFYIGGLDTVTTNTSNILRYLATHQEEQRYLRENPDQIRVAIEEFLRIFAAVTTYRVCIKERTIKGVTIKPGDKVAMCTTLAGRDATVYDDPHEVRLDRNPTHMTFATGPHHCLGVHLARRELRVALEEVFKAIPQFRLDTDKPIKSQAGVIIQPQSLPLRWD